jgi:hypothetical protein
MTYLDVGSEPIWTRRHIMPVVGIGSPALQHVPLYRSCMHNNLCPSARTVIADAV